MATNKVVYGGKTIIDLTKDTLNNPNQLAKGVIAHTKDGNTITGTLESTSGGSATIKSATNTPNSNTTSISFTVDAKPKMFSVINTTQFKQSSTMVVNSVTSDGSTTNGIYTNQSSIFGYGTVHVSSSYFNYTYSNGTLTIHSSSSSNGGYFKSGCTYKLNYVY